MNLREFISLLECQGMPEASEFHVMAMKSTTSQPLSLSGIDFDSESETVWLKVGRTDE